MANENSTKKTYEFRRLEDLDLIDNFLFQPLIYSTSIKSSPLEIFIVLLMAGHLGGIIGMLVAIPAYTVIRVVAARFFSDFKPIRRLISATDDEQKS